MKQRADQVLVDHEVLPEAMARLRAGGTEQGLDLLLALCHRVRKIGVPR